jgi:DNA-binding MarR family transcriptional regulator
VHLLHRESQRADDLFTKEVGEIGLTRRQFAVLLAAAQSEAPTRTDIVDWTGIDRSTVARMSPRMVKKGLLQRRRSRQDARAIIVRLTETGRNTNGRIPSAGSSTPSGLSPKKCSPQCCRAQPEALHGAKLKSGAGWHRALAG